MFAACWVSRPECGLVTALQGNTGKWYGTGDSGTRELEYLGIAVSPLEDTGMERVLVPGHVRPAV